MTMYKVVCKRKERLSMSCQEALSLMHEYLDGDLDRNAALELKKHLVACPDCNRLFRDMMGTESLIATLPKPAVPDGLSERIMAQIPKPKPTSTWKNWVRRHPAVTAVSLFLIVMAVSLFSLSGQNQGLTIKGDHLDRLVIEGNTVVVPSGYTLEGKLMVKGGNVRIDGDVNGDLVIVDGNYQLASTAQISGQITQIDKTLEWILYQVNDFFANLTK